jgi:hypothetical protein
VAKIAATEERVFAVPASPRESYAFFSDPERLFRASAGVERYQVLPGGRVRWVLEEKVEKGIRYRADFVAAYEGNGNDHIVCRTVEGNLRDDWEVWIRPAGGGSEIRYRETVEPDLPITPVLALLIRPLIVRQMREEMRRFLDRAREQLGG